MVTRHGRRQVDGEVRRPELSTTGNCLSGQGVQSKDDSKWQWLRYDLDYWAGDDIHIELSSARDAPLLTKPSDRSWFGISDAVLVPNDVPAPVEPKHHLGPVFAEAKTSPPAAFSDLESIYINALKKCVKAWKQGNVNNEMASFLNGCLEDGLLPNTMQELVSANALIRRYRELENQLPVPTRVPTLAEWRGQDQPMFSRGNHKKPVEPVSRRFLEAIDPSPYQSRLSGRLELAEDLLRRDNPLTRRVIVNRVWHHLFGRGIVSTVDNFGRMGEKPSHPELLDYLANRFVADGWSVKKLIRLIVTSETWQQDSNPSREARETDPENRLLSHFNVRRLEAESIRDSLLAAGGSLDHSLYGPPVGGRSNRRSVYVAVVRNQLDPFLSTFDAPVPFATKGRRDVTTVPAQSLAMFNDPFVLSLTRRVASSVRNKDAFVPTIWRRLLGRDPSDEERIQAQRLVDSLRSKYDELAHRRATLQDQLAKNQREADSLFNEARSRLTKTLVDQAKETPSQLEPTARWNFDENLRDMIGDLHGEVRGNARVEQGALVLDGNGWVSTPPLPKPLKAKTLQVRVLLNDLNQSGGGVMTVQTLDGERFDSIVFAELQPKRWLAGSDYHRRTNAFGGADEVEAMDQPVVITVVYQADGEIIGYRNGKRYGQPYPTETQAFAKGDAQIVFGLRHGNSVVNDRMLHGKILDATLYDRALTPEEVSASATDDHQYISAPKVFAAMTLTQKRRISELNQSIETLKTEFASLGDPVDADQAYADLVLAVFNLKEFIYVR